MAQPLPVGMPALTLWQPWASLIAEGVKTIETRSWPAPKWLVGEDIAIHAAAKRPPDTWADEHPSVPWLDLDAMAKHYAVDEASDVPGVFRYRWVGPLGAVVATARLVDCVPMEDLDAPCDEVETLEYPRVIYLMTQNAPGDFAMDVTRHGDPSELQDVDVTDQLPYGDFAPGRWAWLLDEITPTTVLCPWCGTFVADCLVCDGAGSCDPIPAKGRQRLWRWSP